MHVNIYLGLAFIHVSAKSPWQLDSVRGSLEYNPLCLDIEK